MGGGGGGGGGGVEGGAVVGRRVGVSGISLPSTSPVETEREGRKWRVEVSY